MGREGNTGRRSDIRAQYDTPCPFSKPHPPKEHLMIPGAFGSEITQIPPMDEVLRRHRSNLEAD
jgi:hypothetical protein